MRQLRRAGPSGSARTARSEPTRASVVATAMSASTAGMTEARAPAPTEAHQTAVAITITSMLHATPAESRASTTSSLELNVMLRAAARAAAVHAARERTIGKPQADRGDGVQQVVAVPLAIGQPVRPHHHGDGGDACEQRAGDGAPQRSSQLGATATADEHRERRKRAGDAREHEAAADHGRDHEHVEGGGRRAPIGDRRRRLPVLGQLLRHEPGHDERAPRAQDEPRSCRRPAACSSGSLAQARPHDVETGANARPASIAGRQDHVLELVAVAHAPRRRIAAEQHPQPDVAHTRPPAASPLEGRASRAEPTSTIVRSSASVTSSCACPSAVRR